MTKQILSGYIPFKLEKAHRDKYLNIYLCIYFKYLVHMNVHAYFCVCIYFCIYIYMCTHTLHM
jgi:hypothetical protein